MNRIAFAVAVVLFTGCGKGVDAPTIATKQTPPVVQSNRSNPCANIATEGSSEIPFSGRSGEETIEGVLKGSWLRQQSGEILGDLSKVTLLDPVRLVVGGRSLPLLGGTKEMEQTLLENSGKKVRLTGYVMTWIENGRGIQNPQAGYTGAMPAHVVQFPTVSECEVIVTGAE